MESKKKDGWEKYSILSPLLVSLVVVVFGGIITTCLTQKYQQDQQKTDNKLKQIDLLVKLMPYLSSKDPLQNRVAIYSIRALGYDTLAGEVGASINTIGTREALKTLSRDSSIPIKNRRIYIDKWNQLKKIPPTAPTKDTLQVWADAEGNVMTDANGAPILFESGKILKNENGKPLLNENGKALLNESAKH